MRANGARAVNRGGPGAEVKESVSAQSRRSFRTASDNTCNSDINAIA